MSERSWRVERDARAAKDLRRLDPPVRQRVIAALDHLAEGDASVDVRRLRGGDQFRLRVGDWRVRLVRDDDAHVIRVERVLPRPRGRVYDR